MMRARFLAGWRARLRGQLRASAWIMPMFIAACVPSGHLRGEQAFAPTFDPVAFFAGKTEGRGMLTILLRRPQPTLVEGKGTVTSDGTIRLSQEVSRGGAKPTNRTWRLRLVGPGRYAGSLTDATGLVSAQVSGNLLHIRFAMKGGLHAQQWLYLAADGQSARNRMVVTKWGLPVASLDEVIARKS